MAQSGGHTSASGNGGGCGRTTARTATRRSVLAAVVLIAVTTAACGGGGARTEVSAGPSRGQELIDLKKAYESGIITKEEYDKQRKKVLNQ